MGSVQYPVQLVLEANDNHSYQNQEIQTALEDSFHIIAQIIDGTLAHPIMEEFEEWKTSAPRPSGGILNSSIQTFDHICKFEKLFKIDILPADKSLIQPFIVNLDLRLRFHPHQDIRPHTSMLGNVLFGIVILRVYLGRPPSDDLQIYWLARDFNEDEVLDMVAKRLRGNETSQFSDARCGTIRRAPYPVEGALLSCIKPIRDNGVWTRPSSHFAALSGMHTTIGRLKLNIYNDRNGLPQVTAHDYSGSVYEFEETNDQGLSGGPPFQSAVAPPFRMIRPAPKPKKRLAKGYTQAVVTAAPTAELSKLKRYRENEDEIEGPQEKEEIQGPPLRRSKRRKVLKTFIESDMDVE